MDSRPPVMPFFMDHPIPDEENNIWGSNRERDYFRQMYPIAVKRYLRVIVEVLDRMDRRESYIYDEYPDKIRLERLSEIILEMIPLEKNISRESQRNLVKVLLWDEVIQRRSRNSL